MRSSIFLVATAAILAAATPVVQERNAPEGVQVTTAVAVEMKWVTKYVTKGQEPRPTWFRNKKGRPSTTIEPVISSSTPAPSSSTPPPPPPAETPPPPPAPVPEIPVVVPEIPAAPPVPETPVTPAPPPVQEAPTSGDYADTVIYHHNVHRANHSAPGLAWDDALASYALQTAKRCVFEHDLAPGGGGYGQNLAMYGTSSGAQSFGANRAGAQACSNYWYNGELDKFPASDYGKPSPNMGRFHDWGHFSQVVWKGTQKVGCVSYLCPAGTMTSMDSWFTVCNYSPAGNMGGAYAQNVSPPQGAPPVSAS